jgi:hypothetical protein
MVDSNCSLWKAVCGRFSLDSCDGNYRLELYMHIECPCLKVERIERKRKKTLPPLDLSFDALENYLSS